jgi:ornithine carbamoyltransferase
MRAVIVPGHLKGRHFLRVNDWSAEDLFTVLDLADRMKARRRQRVEDRHLEGRILGMIFTKPSTRTRVSFETGIAHLGGTGLYLSATELQLGRGETIRDTAVVLSRYLDAIMIRTFRQADVDELAEHADVPVVNGLTDEFHPCQALADVMTIRERFGTVEGVRVAYLGDGNNVCHSLMVACAKLGGDFVAATPKGYEPSEEVVRWAISASIESGGSVELVHDPTEAAREADVLYADVWTSMGQDDERERRLRDLEAFRVDDGTLRLASERGVVMHCLPAHYGEEVTEDVLHGPRSAAWDQAENRLHAQKALMALVIR